LTAFHRQQTHIRQAFIADAIARLDQKLAGDLGAEAIGFGMSFRQPDEELAVADPDFQQQRGIPPEDNCPIGTDRQRYRAQDDAVQRGKGCHRIENPKGIHSLSSSSERTG
jgi:hypothetical protein